MPASAIAGTIAGFAAIVGLGALMRRLGLLRAEDSRPLNAVIVYVGLPAFIFDAVHSARLEAASLAVVGVAWVVFTLSALVAWAVARVMRLSRARTAALVLVAALGNTGYIGYPLTAAMFGADAVPAAIFYDVFGTVFALVLVGMPIAARAGGVGGDRPRVNLLRELLTFPAILALGLALVLHGVAVPEPVRDWLELLGRMVAPLIMLSVGISLRSRGVWEAWPALLAAAAVRLVIAPAVAVGVASLLVADAVTARVAVLEAGVPSMMLTLAVGERFGLDTDFIASAIFVTTLLSAVSIPTMQALLG